MSGTHLKGAVTSTNGFVGDVTGDVTGDITGDVTGYSIPVTEARTVTTTGATTGTISANVNFVTVTSDSADKILILPAPVPGTVLYLRNAGTGYELRSSAPTTIAINGGTGSAVESAIAANIMTKCVCDSATTWVCTDYAADGTFAATAAAA